jgi:chitodextrinase
MDGGSPLTGYIVERLDLQRRNWKRTATTVETRSTVINLITGQAYKFRVYAENKVGISEPVETPDAVVVKEPFGILRNQFSINVSILISMLNIPDLPGPPSQPTITLVSGTEVTLSWSAPENNGNTPITGYYVESRQLPATKWIRTNRTAVIETMFTVNNLLENYEYEFRVVAENKVGSGPPSVWTTPIKIKPLYARPSVPMNVTAAMSTPTTVTVNWIAPENNGGTPIIHYVIESKSINEINWKPGPENPADVTTMLKNLKTGLEYIIRVKAVNKVGSSEFVLSTPVKLQEPQPTGFAPKISPQQDLVTATVEGQQISMTFDITGEPIPEISWKKAGKPIKSSDERQLSFENGIATMTVSKVELLHNANYNIEAKNKLGTDKVEFTVTVTAPPTLDTDQKVFKIIKDETLTIKARFSGTPSPTILWFKDNTALSPRKNMAIDINHTSTKITVQKVTPEDAGMYMVKAVNPSGEETLTFAVEVIAKPVAPKGPLVVDNIQQTSCQVSWSAPETDGAEPLTEYLIEKRDVRKSTWVRVTAVKSEMRTVTVEGLMEGTDYLIRVSAVNRLGAGEPLEIEKPVTPKNPFSAPSPPVGPLLAEEITADTITLTWNPPINDGGQALTSYVVEKKEYLKRGWIKVTTTDATTTTFTVKKLSEDSEYDFRVFAVNPKGTSEPLQTDRSIKTRSLLQSPSTPQGPFKVIFLTAESAILEWQSPKENGGSPITEYDITITDHTDETSKNRTCKAFETSYEITDAKGGHSYSIEVRAVNKIGKSPPAISQIINIPKKSGKINLQR